MNQILQSDKIELLALLQSAYDQAIEFLTNLERRPAGLYYDDYFPETLPERGSGSQGAMRSFTQAYGNGLTGSAGPRYLGFVTGGTTPAGLAGDWLASAFDQNVASAGDSSANQVEYQAIDWLKELFGVDRAYAGTFVTGATMSGFTNLAIARQWVGEQRGIDIAQTGMAKLGELSIFSGTPHSSIYKALSMLGIGRDALVKTPVIPGREAINVSALEVKLASLDGQTCIVVANAGTVNTVDFDDLEALAQLKAKYSFWLHVDAAFGGFAACSPQYAHLMNGINYADSITIDLHKFLNVPYDSAIQLTRHRDLQRKVFQNSGAKYLEVDSSQIPFVHLTPENSRRFRALPAWFSLKAYGREGYQEIVERNVSLAKTLGAWIVKSKYFHLLAEVNLNVVCFTFAVAYQKDIERLVPAFLKALTNDGRVFLTPSSLRGIPCIRAAFSNWQTTEKDLDVIMDALEEVAEGILKI